MSNTTWTTFTPTFLSSLQVWPEQSLGPPQLLQLSTELTALLFWLPSILHCSSWLHWSLDPCLLFSDLRTAAGTAGPPGAPWLRGLAGHRPCSTEPVSACPGTLWDPTICCEAFWLDVCSVADTDPEIKGPGTLTHILNHFLSIQNFWKYWIILTGLCESLTVNRKSYSVPGTPTIHLTVPMGSVLTLCSIRLGRRLGSETSWSRLGPNIFEHYCTCYMV